MENSEGTNTRENFRNPFVLEASERRRKILELAKKVGFFNMDSKILAQQFGISQRSIQKDLNWIRGHYKPEELRNIKIELDLGAKRAFAQAMLMVSQANTIGEHAQANKSLLDAIATYKKVLEEWSEGKPEDIRFVIERTGLSIKNLDVLVDYKLKQKESGYNKVRNEICNQEAPVQAVDDEKQAESEDIDQKGEIKEKPQEEENDIIYV
jgi:transcriptional antiterminator